MNRFCCNCSKCDDDNKHCKEIYITRITEVGININNRFKLFTLINQDNINNPCYVTENYICGSIFPDYDIQPLGYAILKNSNKKIIDMLISLNADIKRAILDVILNISNITLDINNTILVYDLLLYVINKTKINKQYVIDLATKHKCYYLYNNIYNA